MIDICAAFLCFASAISANKIILYAFPPGLLVGIRMLAAAPLLAGYVYLKEGSIIAWQLLKKVFLPLAGVALFTTFVPSNLKAYALANMPSYKMAYFGTLDPFVAALYSNLRYGESLTRRQWYGITVGIVGMFLLLMGSSSFEEQLQAFSIFSYPEIAALCAIIISRIGWIHGQYILKRDSLQPLQFNILTMAIGGLLSLFLYLMAGTTVIDIHALQNAQLPLLLYAPLNALSTATQLGFFLGYTIIIGNMLGYNIYAYALKRYSATFIALSGFMIPLLVQLIGWTLLGEPLSSIFIMACAVTFIGVAIFFYDERTMR